MPGTASDSYFAAGYFFKTKLTKERKYIHRHTVAPSRTKSSYEKGGLRTSRTYSRMSRQTSDTDSPKAAVIMTKAP